MAKKKTKDDKAEPKPLTMEEQIAKSIEYLQEKPKMTNFALVEFRDEGTKTTKIVEFWIDKGKLIIKDYHFVKSFNPDTIPNGFTLQKFQDENYYTNFYEVYEKIIKRYDAFIYHPKDLMIHLVACGAIASHYPEIFDAFPYFDFYAAEPSSGKTSFLQCLTYSSYYGNFTVDPSKASINRMINSGNCMLGIDELGKLLKGEHANTFSQVILTGYRKGGRVPRCKDGAYDIIEYLDIFSLKGWSRLEWINPQLLERAITINMFQSSGRKHIPSMPKPEDFKDIRDDLMILRLMKNDDVAKVYNELKKIKDLFDRIKEIFLPLLTIAKIVDRTIYDKIYVFALETQERYRTTALNIRHVIMMEILHENQFFEEVSVPKIRNAYRDRLVEREVIPDVEEIKVKITSQKVMAILDRLAFKKVKKFAQSRAHYMIDFPTFKHQAFTYLKDKYDEIKEIKEERALTEREKSLLYFFEKEKKESGELGELSEFGEFGDVGELSDVSELSVKESSELGELSELKKESIDLSEILDSNMSDTEKIVEFIKAKSKEDCNSKVIHQTLANISGLTSKLELLRRDGIIAEMKGNWRFI